MAELACSGLPALDPQGIFTEVLNSGKPGIDGGLIMPYGL